jgi:predicted transcriptional regulator
MASPTSLKLDDELKGRVQRLAEVRRSFFPLDHARSD